MRSSSELRVLAKLTIGLIGLGLVICLGTMSTPSNAQPSTSIRGPGDTTLHGNPDCDRWLTLDSKVKGHWLAAILNPINMTYVLRERPEVNRFVALPSLAPAVEYVDAFCVTQTKSKAMSAALNYFEALVRSPGK